MRDDECTGNRLQRRGRAHGVTEHGFNGADGDFMMSIPKDRLNGGTLILIIRQRTRAVGTDIINGVARQICFS